MNERDYNLLQYSILMFMGVIISQFVLFVWYFSIPVSWPFISFIASLGIIGIFLALVLEYKKKVFVGEMKKYLQLKKLRKT